jgi:hypothetical protein
MVSFQNLQNEEEESETNTGDTEDENLIQVSKKNTFFLTVFSRASISQIK